jgi:hypothetical protein
MLSKRGFVVLDDDLHMRVEDFAAQFGGDIPNREKMGMLVFKRDNEQDKLFVFFPNGDVGTAQVTECVGRCCGDEAGRTTARCTLTAPPPHSALPFM